MDVPVCPQDVENFVFRQVETERFHGHLELVVVDVPVFVEVEELELRRGISAHCPPSAKSALRAKHTASLISSRCSSLSSAKSPRPAFSSLSRSALSARSRSSRCASRCWCDVAAPAPKPAADALKPAFDGPAAAPPEGPAAPVPPRCPPSPDVKPRPGKGFVDAMGSYCWTMQERDANGRGGRRGAKLVGSAQWGSIVEDLDTLKGLCIAARLQLTDRVLCCDGAGQWFGRRVRGAFSLRVRRQGCCASLGAPVPGCCYSSNDLLTPLVLFRLESLQRNHVILALSG